MIISAVTRVTQTLQQKNKGGLVKKTSRYAWLVGVCLCMSWAGAAGAAKPDTAAERLANQAGKERGRGRVLYQVKAKVTGQERAALAAVQAQYGLKLRRQIGGRISDSEATARNFQREEEICLALLATGAVDFAEPDYLEHPLAQPNDPLYGTQWHHPLMNSPAAWDITTGHPSVIVAVLDTGVQSNHPDLAANLILPGYNSVDKSTNSEDFWGHGTAVAGCVAAVGNNGTGVVGMAWNVKILPIRISNNLDTATAYLSDMAAGMIYAADHGAKVTNLSYGGAYSSTIDSAARYVRSKGGLHFMSAGNDNADISGNPDWASFIIVGATTSSDTRSSFSNYGTPIDLVAPGTSVYTTRRTSTYGYASGTSFSSPIAAGVGAMIYSVLPSFTPEEVENILFATCVDLGAAGDDNIFGHGRINAGAAVQLAALSTDRPPVAVLNATPVRGVEPLEVFFDGSASYSDSGSIVSYAWTFGDGATASGPAGTHTYLAAGSYVATLTVTDDNGLSGQDSVTIQVDPAAFLAPSNLSASVSGRTVTLRWNDNTPFEDGYYIERGIKSKAGTTWTRVGQVGVNVTTYSETVSAGTYQYRVQAFSQSRGVTGYSNVIQVKVR
jgi:thermitase